MCGRRWDCVEGIFDEFRFDGRDFSEFVMFWGGSCDSIFDIRGCGCVGVVDIEVGEGGLGGLMGRGGRGVVEKFCGVVWELWRFYDCDWGVELWLWMDGGDVGWRKESWGFCILWCIVGFIVCWKFIVILGCILIDWYDEVGIGRCWINRIVYDWVEE